VKRAFGKRVKESAKSFSANRTGDRPITIPSITHRGDPTNGRFGRVTQSLSLRQRRHDARFHSPSERAASFVGSGIHRDVSVWIDSRRFDRSISSSGPHDRRLVAQTVQCSLTITPRHTVRSTRPRSNNLLLERDAIGSGRGIDCDGERLVGQ